MTSEQRNQIRALTRQPVGSIWGYWPFVLPVLLVIIGIVVQVVLLRYFESRYGSFDILIRQGKKIEVLWEAQLVKEAVLTISLSITLTFALLAFLARRSYRQATLLRAAAGDLGIESGQQNTPSNGPRTGRLSASPETRSSDPLRTSSSGGCG